MKLSLARACLFGLTATLTSCVSRADVHVELSSDRIRQDETVQLRLKADGANLQPPDFSALDTDFTILDRRVQRSRSTINGRRRERVGLTLILSPKRTGSLVIPAISFGTESTRPLELTVTVSAAQNTPVAPSTGDAAPPHTGAFWSDPYLPPWQPYGPPPPLYADPNGLAPGLLDLPLAPPSSQTTDLTETGDDTLPAPSARPEKREGTLQDPWFWTSLILAFGLIVSLFRRRPWYGAAPMETETPPPLPVEQPLIEPPTIAAIRVAYETHNAAAARNALLAWGRDAFPRDPPANLVRLAMRCDEPARQQITLLEQASYSPTPIEWNRAPVWEWLQGSHSRTDA